MLEKIIESQAEWDALPDKFEEYTRIVLTGKIRITVARENASVEARGTNNGAGIQY